MPAPLKGPWKLDEEQRMAVQETEGLRPGPLGAPFACQLLGSSFRWRGFEIADPLASLLQMAQEGQGQDARSILNDASAVW